MLGRAPTTTTQIMAPTNVHMRMELKAILELADRILSLHRMSDEPLGLLMADPLPRLRRPKHRARERSTWMLKWNGEDMTKYQASLAYSELCVSSLYSL